MLRQLQIYYEMFQKHKSHRVQFMTEIVFSRHIQDFGVINSHEKCEDMTSSLFVDMVETIRLICLTVANVYALLACMLLMLLQQML